MWVVAKIKIKDIEIFKKHFVEKCGDEINFYTPKFLFSQHYKDKIKKFDRFVLENYIFCYHEKFNKSCVVNKFQHTKGLQYFLNGHIQSQKEIQKFISYCNNQQLEVNSNQIEVVKRLEQYYQGNFQSYFSKLFSKS